jgi:hypothetical protein
MKKSRSSFTSWSFVERNIDVSSHGRFRVRLSINGDLCSWSCDDLSSAQNTRDHYINFRDRNKYKKRIGKSGVPYLQIRSNLSKGKLYKYLYIPHVISVPIRDLNMLPEQIQTVVANLKTKFFFKQEPTHS